MKKILKYISLSILFPCFLFSQTGSLNDPLFNVFNNGFIQLTVYTSCIQPDGKLLVGGQFSNCSSSGILRLNNNGGIDSTFIAPNIINYVKCIALQADGKIIVGGGGGLINRLNSDGSIDPSFNSSFNNIIKAISIQSDGKIIVGGMFTTVNLIPKNAIVRLNTDGTIDNTFNIGSGFFNTSGTSVNTIVIQSNGQILTGGIYTAYNGQGTSCLSRLNADGTIDLSAPFSCNNLVNTIVIQPDNKILIGGLFTSVNGTTKNTIARLNYNGTIDLPFNSGTGFLGGAVKTISLQSDGKVIVGGGFTTYNGITNNKISRLNSDGSLDITFSSNNGFDSDVETTVLDISGSIYVGGMFTKYNGILGNFVTKLNSNGSLNSFLGGIINTIKQQSNGKIVLGGSFKEYNGVIRNGIVRLNTDGLIDNSLNPGIGFNGHVNSIGIQSDGKIIVAGFFSSYNGLACSNIIRINSDGTADLTFNYGAGFNSEVKTVSIQSDGKIIVGGSFTSYNGTTVNRIARLNTNGIVDASFIYGTGFNGTVNSTNIQSNGRIIVGGSFTSFNGITRNYIARLIPSNGNFDNTFTIGTGFNSEVRAIEIQSDGKILIGGYFTVYNALTITRSTRLNSNGTVDLTFNPPTINGGVSCISIQSDGKIILAGIFAPSRIFRLNSDGTLDLTFNYGTGFNWNVNTSIIQSDGKILLGGAFTCFDGYVRSKMVRLLPCVSPSSIVTVIGSTTLCQGNVVTLNVTSGVGLTYQWQNNGVNINGATSSTYSANTAGNYTAVVTSNGCSSTSTPIAIVVNPLPNATITSSGPTSFCLGNTVLLSTAPIAGQSYQWQNNGVNINGATSSTFSANTAGNYTLIVNNSNGCSSISNAIIITIINPVMTSFNVDSICSGSALNLPLTCSYNGATFSWAATVNDSISGESLILQTSNVLSDQLINLTSNEQLISYTVTPFYNGCFGANQTITVNVFPLPIASISNAVSTTICPGNSIVLNALLGQNLNYQWQNNGQNISNASTSTYNANVTGNVSYIVTNAGGCASSSQSIAITFPKVQISTLTPLAENNVNTPITFYTSILNFGNNPNYQWYKNGLLVGANTPSYTNNSWINGEKIVCRVTSSSGCSVYSNDLFVWLAQTNQDSWQRMADIGLDKNLISQEFPTRTGGITFSIGNKIYVGLGYNDWHGNLSNPNEGCLSDFWEYNIDTKEWTERAPFAYGNSPRAGAVAFVCNGKGYVGFGCNDTYLSWLGGTTYNDLWEYNPQTDTWTQKTSCPGLPRHSAVAVSINNNGYVGTGVGLNTIVSDWWKYDPVNDNWIQRLSIPLSNCGLTAAVVNDKIFVTGVSSNFQYDPTLNTWTTKANFPAGARYYAKSFTINDTMYVCGGGTAPFTDCSSILTSGEVWAYVASSNIWIQKANMPLGNISNGCAISAAGKGFYISGGSQQACLSNGYWRPGSYGRETMLEYNSTSDSWDLGTPLGGVKRKFGFSEVIGDYGYALMQYAGTAFNVNGDNQVYLFQFDSKNNSWVQKSKYPGQGTWHFGVGFTLNGKLYYGSGMNAPNSLVNDFWEYDPVLNSWTQILNVPTSLTNGFSFILNNKAYIGGNQLGTSFFEFDPNNNQWIPRANLSNTSVPNISFSLNNYGYVALITGVLAKYDPNNNLWINIGSLPGLNTQISTSYVSCTASGKGYYTGLGPMYEFSPLLNTWYTVSSCPADKIGGSAFSFPNKAYLFGGQENIPNSPGHVLMVNDTWQYNPSCLTSASINPNTNLSFCSGDSVLFNTNTGIGFTYQWQNNGVNIAGANASSLYVTAAGNYSLILTDNYSCSSNSDTINVILNSIPNVSLSPFIQYCDTIGIVQLSGGVPAGGNYSGNSVINNSFNTNVGTGTYLITYQYAGNNGCSSADSENLTVVNCSNNSIDDNFSYSILIYPNPTNSNITLEVISELIGKSYSILDFSGRIIREGKISSAQEHIDLQGVARGVYYLSIENGSSVIKLVKQ